ncbi:MAG TPA: hypothetical protein VHS03_13565 [Gaiellaceae bacterium]|nr:hypothetical protein [Gaiellaceae bacterium]
MIERQALVRPAVAALLGAIALGVAIAVRPGDSSLAAEAFVLLIGAIAVAFLAKATSDAFDRATDSQLQIALRPPQRKEERIADLARLERELEMSTESAYDVHYRLRPIFREIASSRLARSAVELDAPGGRAEQLLGPDAWAFVRPDAARPSDHYAPGAQLAEIERAIDALEKLGR